MISKKVLNDAIKTNSWIIIHLKEDVRNLDHVECLSNDFLDDKDNKLIYGFCPCDGIRWCIPYKNIKCLVIVPPQYSPHLINKIRRITASQYLEVETNFSCKDSLIAGLEEMYGIGNVEYHEVATNLRGYQGDVRKNLANIIVRKKCVGNASNDLGFLLTKDGTYKAQISEFDKRSHFGDAKLHKLEALYSKNVIQKTAVQRRQRCTIEQKSPTKIVCKVYI